MVNAQINILNALNSGNIDNLDIDNINQLIEKYPYFQALKVLKIQWLKKNHKDYHNCLQQAAARTIDRQVLYEIIEQKKPDRKKTELPISSSKLSKPVFKPKTKQTAKKVSIRKPALKPIKPKKSTIEKNEKRNYIDWLNQFKTKHKTTTTPSLDPIEKFLKERPKIVPKKNVTIKTPEIIEKSVVEKQMLMTETLANLYVKQKKYDKAIQAFRILSLKYPKKSSYFANQIKEIKQNLK